MRTALCRVVALVLAVSTFPACATKTGPTDGGAANKVIAVTKECLVTAGRENLGEAVLAVETALANPSPAGAMIALTGLGGKYTISAVSCLVHKVLGESTVNYAQSNGTDALSATKMGNARQWLSEHPAGE